MRKDIIIILVFSYIFQWRISFLLAPADNTIISRRFTGYTYLGYFKITAYEYSKRSCGKWADGRTAMNMVVDYGICAVDPEVIPLGQIIYVKDIGYFITADTGKKVKGKVIDIYMSTVKECKRFGVRYKKVFLVKLNYYNKKLIKKEVL